MLSPSYSISPEDLWNLMATPDAPQSSMCGGATLLTNRRSFAGRGLARCRHAQAWSREFDRARPIVVACKAGQEMSQMHGRALRADGFDARVLEGGYAGRLDAGWHSSPSPRSTASYRSGPARGSHGGDRKSTASPARG